MWANLREFAGKHWILATIATLTLVDAAKRAVTGKGLVPSKTTFMETISPGESGTATLSSGTAIELDSLLGSVVSVTSSDPSTLSIQQGAGSKILATAVKPGTATLSVMFDSPNPSASLVWTIT